MPLTSPSFLVQEYPPNQGFPHIAPPKVTSGNSSTHKLLPPQRHGHRTTRWCGPGTCGETRLSATFNLTPPTRPLPAGNTMPTSVSAPRMWMTSTNEQGPRELSTSTAHFSISSARNVDPTTPTPSIFPAKKCCAQNHLSAPTAVHPSARTLCGLEKCSPTFLGNAASLPQNIVMCTSQ